jgi:hypothetical protein
MLNSKIPPLTPSLNLRTISLFMTEDPQWVFAIRHIGWWILLCPPFGWLIALGYRKEVVLCLACNSSSPLPKWQGAPYLLWEGIKALGVIIVYFSPYIICAWHWGSPSGWNDLYGGLCYVLMSLSLVPITLPLTPIIFSLYDHGFSFTFGESLFLLVSSIGITFFIPLGFMRVARRGRFIDALHIFKAASILMRHGRRYVHAWWLSLRLTFSALSLGPFTPWGIAWSYLGIVYSFNHILATSPHSEDRRYYQDGWLINALPHLDIQTHDQADTPSFRIISLWVSSLPIPNPLSSLFLSSSQDAQDKNTQAKNTQDKRDPHL